MNANVSTSEPSDEMLAAQAAAGDDSAFEMIVDRFQARIFRLACRLTSETDAPDILQETFLQAYRHLSSFRGESQFGTWLYRIATNAALMHRRASSRRPSEPLDTFLPRFDDQGKHAATPAELQVAARADELLDRQFLAGKAREMLARLPDIYRDAFVLKDLEEMSTAEAARALDIDPAAVRQRVHRARLMLRGYLSDLVGGEIMREIACLSGVELLMEYLEGVLPPDLHAALEAHVAGCARCVAFVGSYRATPRILREATAVKIPDTVEASLKTFVQRLLQKRSET